MKDKKNAGEMTLGKKIRQLRIERRITQQELVGDFITRNMLSQIENDVAMPSMKTLQYLADTLEIPLSQMVDNESEIDNHSGFTRVGREEILEDFENLHRSFLDGRISDCLSLCEKLENCEVKGDFLKNYIQKQAKLYKIRCLAIREINMGSEEFLKKTADETDLCRYNIMLSEKFLSEGDVKNAIDCLRQAETIIEPFPAHPYNSDVYKAFELCYVKLEDYKNAHLYSTKLLELLAK